MRPNLGPLRRRVESRMTTGCVIGTVGWVYDPVTETDVQKVVPKWSGRCWVRPKDRDPGVVTVAGQLLTVNVYDVWLPVDANYGDAKMIEFTDAPGDPKMVGTRLTIAASALDDWQVARRLVCQRST